GLRAQGNVEDLLVHHELAVRPPPLSAKRGGPSTAGRTDERASDRGKGGDHLDESLRAARHDERSLEHAPEPHAPRESRFPRRVVRAFELEDRVRFWAR